MPLTDLKIRNAKGADKPYKLFDERGLYLLVSPIGTKLWRLKYRVGGKEKTLSLGAYPDVPLRTLPPTNDRPEIKGARDRRDEARNLLSAGIDPSELRKQQKLERKAETENTFEIIGREWHNKQRPKWTTKHAADVLRRLEGGERARGGKPQPRRVQPDLAGLFKPLGARPIHEIEAREVLSALREVEARGAHEIAHRLLQIAGQIFRYAVATGRAKADPTRDLRGALAPKRRVRGHAALSEEELPDFLYKLRNYDGTPQTKAAMRLLLLTFVRTGELRGAEWSEFDFEKAQWRIPAERMKMEAEHLVPLSTQALEILASLRTDSKQGQRLVFPNQANPTKPMSENTILYALYRMGYHSRATGHGFRATASTILNEQGYRADVIERQLAHSEKNKVRAAYHRSEYLPERRKMMQHWANFLDGLVQVPPACLNQSPCAAVQ